MPSTAVAYSSATAPWVLVSCASSCLTAPRHISMRLILSHSAPPSLAAPRFVSWRLTSVHRKQKSASPCLMAPHSPQIQAPGSARLSKNSTRQVYRTQYKHSSKICPAFRARKNDARRRPGVGFHMVQNPTNNPALPDRSAPPCRRKAKSVAAQPFGRISLNAVRAITSDCRGVAYVPIIPKTFGQHLQKRRKELHLSHQQLARQFGVSKLAVSYWEADWSLPRDAHLSDVIRFIGYDPRTAP